MDFAVFCLFSGGALFSAFRVISHKNPVYSALYLALSLIFLAGVFFLLGAPFLAGLQLIIYAGAVIVLFVMTLMLFDFKKEAESFFKARLWLWPAFLFGVFSGLIGLMALSSPPSSKEPEFFEGSSIALKIFTKYILVFEMIGVLLLAIAVGAVALARSDKG